MQKRIAVCIVAISAPMIFATGCGSSKRDSSAASTHNTFVLSEFTIAAPKKAVRSGYVTITANNVGGESHELVIVRGTDGESLPKRPDGSLDEEKITPSNKVGEIENVAAGSQKSRAFDLVAGDYLAVCNLIEQMGSNSSMAHGSDMGSTTEHVHFALGMFVPFTVT
jgi:hypothetical protein